MAVPISVHAQSSNPRSYAERPRAYAEQRLEEGRRELKRGDTVAAEMAFRKAALLDPTDPMAHYLLANLLARTDRHPEAISEYKMALRLDPGSSVSGYCRQALMAYNRTTFSETASRGEYLPPPPPSHLDNAMDMIDRQARCKKSTAEKFASNLSNSVVRGGDWKAKDIKLSAEHEIALSKPSGRGKAMMTPTQWEAEAKRIRAEADERAKYEQDIARERADSHTAWARERQQQIDDVAGNLKEQLTERPSQFGFDLAANGTGLYVRNYKSSKPKKRLPDPRFSVLRLTEPGIHDYEKGLK